MNEPHRGSVQMVGSNMVTDTNSSTRSALLLSFLFLASILSAPGLFPTVNAENVTHFGNSGSPQSVNITFPSGGHDTSTTLILGANSVVSTASLDVRGCKGLGVRVQPQLESMLAMTAIWNGPSVVQETVLSVSSMNFPMAGILPASTSHRVRIQPIQFVYL